MMGRLTARLPDGVAFWALWVAAWTHEDADRARVGRQPYADARRGPGRAPNSAAHARTRGSAWRRTASRPVFTCGMHRAAAWSAWGCSLECMGLQPGVHGAAAWSAWGCSLDACGCSPVSTHLPAAPHHVGRQHVRACWVACARRAACAAACTTASACAAACAMSSRGVPVARAALEITLEVARDALHHAGQVIVAEWREEAEQRVGPQHEHVDVEQEHLGTRRVAGWACGATGQVHRTAGVGLQAGCVVRCAAAPAARRSLAPSHAAARGS
jgi:hypothetical protein